MSKQLPRRTFLLGWLGALLAGWLGRSQAQAIPNPKLPPVPNPSAPQSVPLHCGSLGSGLTVFRVEGLPEGVILDANTGVISGIIKGNS